MKKLAFVVSAIIFCTLFSCNSPTEGGMSEKAKKNLENTKTIIKMFESGDFTKAGDHLAADAVDHTGPMGKEVKGLDSLVSMFKQMGATMTDVKNEVVQGAADDNYSWVWLKQSWTQKEDGASMRMKAGDKGNLETVEVCKHGADGKITDHWGFMSINAKNENILMKTF